MASPPGSGAATLPPPPPPSLAASMSAGTSTDASAGANPGASTGAVAPGAKFGVNGAMDNLRNGSGFSTNRLVHRLSLLLVLADQCLQPLYATVLHLYTSTLLRPCASRPAFPPNPPSPTTHPHLIHQYPGSEH